MSDEFWGDPQGGSHRKPDADPSLKAGIKALLRAPQGVRAPLWYMALALGGLALCVALGGLAGAVLGVGNMWFR